MARETRHAAWQDERGFSVQLLREEEPATELAGGLGDFLDAVDFAVEWLAREDPERNGTASLAILETRAGTTEKVWSYPPDTPDAAPLMKIFGFDPVNWKAAATEFAPKGLPRRAAVPRARAEVAPAPMPPIAPPPPPALPIPRPAVVQVRLDDPLEAVPLRLEPRRTLAAAWDDRVSRTCLCLAAVSLWLALALSSVSVLVLLFVALSGLWWRRDKLVATAQSDAEDWL